MMMMNDELIMMNSDIYWYYISVLEEGNRICTYLLWKSLVIRAMRPLSGVQRQTPPVKPLSLFIFSRLSDFQLQSISIMHGRSAPKRTDEKTISSWGSPWYPRLIDYSDLHLTWPQVFPVTRQSCDQFLPDSGEGRTLLHITSLSVIAIHCSMFTIQCLVRNEGITWFFW